MDIYGHKDEVIYNKKKYIDLSFNSGVLLFGHSSKILQKVFDDFRKKKISLFKKKGNKLVFLLNKLYPNYKKFFFCTTGSEAIAKALRICRAISKKDKIINVAGSWHGSGDETLFNSDKNLIPIKLSDGLTDSSRKNLIYIPCNNIKESKKILERNKKKICCVLVEPIQGCFPNLNIKNYLKFLRSYTKKNKILLIFDEIVTGMRMSKGSAQQEFKIKPDISIFGKSFGGGLPISFIGVTNNVLKKLNNVKVFFGGTFSENNYSVYSSIKHIENYNKNKIKKFKNLLNKCNIFYNIINNFIKKNNLDFQIIKCESIFRIIFSRKKIINRTQRDFFESKKFSRKIIFKKILNKDKIYYPDNGIIFISFASTKGNLIYAANKINQALKRI